MSAFVVSTKHIDYLVSAASLWDLIRPGCDEMDRAARTLELENRRSVACRYREPQTDAGLQAIVDARQPVKWTMKVDPVQVLKAVACLEYQSCEHDSWEGSDAAKLCDQIRRAAIALLPGYEAAAWEIA